MNRYCLLCGKLDLSENFISWSVWRRLHWSGLWLWINLPLRTQIIRKIRFLLALTSLSLFPSLNITEKNDFTSPSFLYHGICNVSLTAEQEFKKKSNSLPSKPWHHLWTNLFSSLCFIIRQKTIEKTWKIEQKQTERFLTFLRIINKNKGDVYSRHLQNFPAIFHRMFLFSAKRIQFVKSHFSPFNFPVNFIVHNFLSVSFQL